MRNKVYIEIKNVYGNNLIYPVCEKAKTFTRLMNKKTFHNYELKEIEKLGYEIKVKANNSWE